MPVFKGDIKLELSGFQKAQIAMFEASNAMINFGRRIGLNTVRTNNLRISFLKSSLKYVSLRSVVRELYMCQQYSSMSLRPLFVPSHTVFKKNVGRDGVARIDQRRYRRHQRKVHGRYHHNRPVRPLLWGEPITISEKSRPVYFDEMSFRNTHINEPTASELELARVALERVQHHEEMVQLRIEQQLPKWLHQSSFPVMKPEDLVIANVGDNEWENGNDDVE